MHSSPCPNLYTVNRIVKNDLRLFKKHRTAELTEANKLTRLQRAHQLLAKYPASLVNFIVFTDKKVFPVARPTNSQNVDIINYCSHMFDMKLLSVKLSQRFGAFIAKWVQMFVQTRADSC